MFKLDDTFAEDFVVTSNVHDGFIGVFGDRHPLHTDALYAAARGFRDKVMHGNILNGFLSYFIGECLPEREVIILSQEIKFQRPVYLGDKLALEAKVIDVHESVNVTEFSCKFRNVSDGCVVASAKIRIGRTIVSEGA